MSRQKLFKIVLNFVTHTLRCPRLCYHGYIAMVIIFFLLLCLFLFCLSAAHAFELALFFFIVSLLLLLLYHLFYFHKKCIMIEFFFDILLFDNSFLFCFGILRFLFTVFFVAGM